ncbi:hypothetical protein DLAC_02118 [Tieghemostelium lacteum]|uniref:Uncharacterized protein n=1 Tax=Tieghemostelium lacteum TaxID=361077 RepID=A0A152A433_TIELA|nr:hypothetical protein DLAC_02118 [Tieghemostelium lacteum]|eukprot:KYR01032.1 hypothetical protein DLAC_02118 [Tieghemostelium lacteum]
MDINNNTNESDNINNFSKNIASNNSVYNPSLNKNSNNSNSITKKKKNKSILKRYELTHTLNTIPLVDSFDYTLDSSDEEEHNEIEALKKKDYRKWQQ